MGGGGQALSGHIIYFQHELGQKIHLQVYQTNATKILKAKKKELKTAKKEFKNPLNTGGGGGGPQNEGWVEGRVGFYFCRLQLQNYKILI